MKRNITPLIFGIFFIIAGLGYIGTMFFDWRFDIFFDGWWTLFIIVPAFVSMLANRPKPFNTCALLVGVLLLLSELDIFPTIHWGTIIVSAVIIFAGLSLISSFFRSPSIPNANISYTYTINTPPNNGSDTTYESNGAAYEPTQPNYEYSGSSKYRNMDNNSRPDYNAILSSIDTKNNSTDFRGATVAAILGGVELDLRDVVITQDIEISCTAILGGVDVWAPRNVRIAMNNTNILGGTDCHALTMPPDANVPLVVFNCTTVMGGVEIK